MLGGVVTDCSAGGGQDTGALTDSDVCGSTMMLLCVVRIVYNKLKKRKNCQPNHELMMTIRVKTRTHTENWRDTSFWSYVFLGSSGSCVMFGYC